MKESKSLTALALVMAISGISGFVSPAFANDTHDVLRTSNGQVVTNSFGNCVRTNWDEGYDPCGATTQETRISNMVTHHAPAHHALGQEQRTIHFAFNKSVLTPEAKAKLDGLTQVMKSEEDVKEAKIVGYADRIGSVSYNDRLSQKRAEAVKDYIISHGYANASVAETRWMGKSDPITSCSDKLKRPELIQCLQKDRRVEVEIIYTPEQVSNNQ